MRSFLQYLKEENVLAPAILSASMAASPVPEAQMDYRVAKGDTISGIAQKNKLSVDQLMALNPEVKDPNKISIGQTIKLNTPKQQPPAVSTKDSSVPAWKPIISEFEGFRSEAYWDDKGKVWTIGKGSTTHPDGRPVREGDKITKKQSDEYMQHYVDTKVIPKLQKIPTWDKMNPNQQAALVSFSYNVGPGFYGSEGFQSITRDLSSEEGLSRVPETLKLYKKSKGTVLPGLIRRREAEGNLWNTPVSTS